MFQSLEVEMIGDTSRKSQERVAFEVGRDIKKSLDLEAKWKKCSQRRWWSTIVKCYIQINKAKDRESPFAFSSVAIEQFVCHWDESTA